MPFSRISSEQFEALRYYQELRHNVCYIFCCHLVSSKPAQGRHETDQIWLFA
jgi:hypothetical protein